MGETLSSRQCVTEPDRWLSPEDVRLQEVFSDLPYEQRKKVIVAHRVAAVIGIKLSSHGNFVKPASNEQIIDYASSFPEKYAAALAAQQKYFDIQNGHHETDCWLPEGYEPMVAQSQELAA